MTIILEENIFNLSAIIGDIIVHHSDILRSSYFETTEHIDIHNHWALCRAYISSLGHLCNKKTTRRIGLIAEHSLELDIIGAQLQSENRIFSLEL